MYGDGGRVKVNGAGQKAECDDLQHDDVYDVGIDDVYDVGIDLTHCFPFEVTATHAIIDSYHQLQGYPGYKNPLICKGDHVISVEGIATQSMSFLQLSRILCGNLHSAVSIVLGRRDESRNEYSSRFTVSILRQRPQKLVFSAAAHGHVASRARRDDHGRDEEQEVDAKRTWAEILEARMPQDKPVLHASSGEPDSVLQEFFQEGSRVGSHIDRVGIDRVGDHSIVPSVDSSGQSLEWSLQGPCAHEMEAKGAELRPLMRERMLKTSPPSSPSEEAKKVSELHRGKAGEKGAGQEKLQEEAGVSTPPQVFAQQADRLDRLSLVVHADGSSRGCDIHEHEISFIHALGLLLLTTNRNSWCVCIRAWWIIHAHHTHTQHTTHTAARRLAQVTWFS